jgi:hypothetical protein
MDAGAGFPGSLPVASSRRGARHRLQWIRRAGDRTSESMKTHAKIIEESLAALEER